MLKLLIWEKSIYLMSVSSSFETLTHCFINKTYYIICGLVKKKMEDLTSTLVSDLPKAITISVREIPRSKIACTKEFVLNYLSPFSDHSCLILFNDSLHQLFPSLPLFYCITLCFMAQW